MLVTQLRKFFWLAHPELSRKMTRINGARMHDATTRTAWCDYVDGMQRSGDLTMAQAQRATIGTSRVYFVNRRGNGYRETVDEFATRKEARAMLVEYNTADPGALHWVSTRACAGWQA